MTQQTLAWRGFPAAPCFLCTINRITKSVTAVGYNSSKIGYAIEHRIECRLRAIAVIHQVISRGQIGASLVGQIGLTIH